MLSITPRNACRHILKCDVVLNSSLMCECRSKSRMRRIVFIIQVLGCTQDSVKLKGLATWLLSYLQVGFNQVISRI